MSAKLFIDGAQGTTGLEIRERLAGRDEFSLIELPEAERRDTAARRDAYARADFAILCLPDDAAREAVRLADGRRVRIIDASTAHRTAPDWTYGFAELAPGQRPAIAGSDRVANPGCYAIAFIALVRPLVDAGLLAADTPLSVHAASGYSGGGRAMIEEYRAPDHPAFRGYALALDHKHLPEMQRHGGLARAPLFAPAVVDAYRGMLLEIPLFADQLVGDAGAEAVAEAYRRHYANSTIVRPLAIEAARDIATVSIERCAGTDRLELVVFADRAGHQLRLCALLDNLGKGAAGSAVQNLNLMAGLQETAGLRL